MVKPFNPDEAQLAKNGRIPDYVIEAVNEMLSEKLDTSGNARFTQDEIIEKIQTKSDIDRSKLFAMKYLDFEDLYRKQGWKVEYDKPAYNESYKAFFVFSRK